MNITKKLKMIWNMDKQWLVWCTIFCVVFVVLLCFTQLNDKIVNMMMTLYAVYMVIGVSCQMTVPFMYMRSLRISHINLKEVLDLAICNAVVMGVIGFVLLSVQSVITQNYLNIYYLMHAFLMFLCMSLTFIPAISKDKTLLEKNVNNYGLNNAGSPREDGEPVSFRNTPKFAIKHLFYGLIMCFSFQLIYGENAPSEMWQFIVLQIAGCISVIGIIIQVMRYSKIDEKVFIEE